MTDTSINSTDRAQDLDRERLFNLALNEEKEANTLLAHYRDRINAFDREREEWLQKLENVRLSQEEAHKTQWELQKRREEISYFKISERE